MSIAIIDTFVVVSFILLGLKWFGTGYFGRVIGQLIFVLPVALFLYLSTLAILYKSKLTLDQQNRCNTLPTLRLNRSGKRQTVLLFFYLILISIALFRTIGVSERFTFFMMSGRFLTIILIVVATYYIFYVYAANGQLDRAWLLITLGIGIYVVVNIAGAVIGIENPFFETLFLVKTDTVLSFWDTSVFFPFSANHGSFSIEAGLLGSLAIAQLLQPRSRNKFVYVLFLLLSTGAIVAANRRTPFVALTIVAAAGIAWKKVGSKLILPIFVILLILPIFLTYVDTLSWLEDFHVNLSLLSRRGRLSELSTFNSRTMIWGHAFDELKRLKAIHFVGFGAFGHVTSGLCYKYARMWSEPELILLHNTYLQYLIDFGYIGLLIFLAMIINIFKILGKTNKVVDKKSIRFFHPAMASMLYLAVCGLLDVNIYFTQILTFYVFMFINYQVIWHEAKTKLQHKIKRGE